MDKNRVYHLAV